MKGVPLGWAVIVLVLAIGWAAAEPTSRPADTQPATQIRQWFLGLADVDAGTRSRCRENLLGLQREELPALRAVVAELAPLEMSLRDDLREIVNHVYLSAEPYDADPNGFLGIKMPQVDGEEMQVVVESRMPGFAGYRALRDGDVVVEIEDDHPLAKAITRQEFVETIKAARPGKLMHLKVLRQGEVIHVPVKLDGRPANNSGENDMVYEQEIAELLHHRIDAAEEYWKKNFQPLVDGKASLPENGVHAGG